MDFPQQTKDLVGKLAAEFRGKSPLSELVAQSVYHYLHGRFSYGFGEGLKQGYFIRWPHEIEREWECIEAATFTYALAEAAGLQPRMLSVKRWNGLDTGHETVDVLVDGKRVLIDPLNSMFGAASYDSQGIAVQDNPHTGRCVLPCTQPEEVPRQRAINRIDYYRSDEGIINLLRAGQSYQVGATQRVFISYDPKLRVFEQQMRASMPFLDPLYYSERRFLGGNRTEYEVGTYDGADWLCLEGKEQFWRVTEEHLPFTVAVKFGAEP
ncbi:hypothetical protein HY642_00760, partial [Candidatus Woesearchaeota archaeon]|nr:hypothetical protein [Candidatus Woesearchaeota archaeon]